MPQSPIILPSLERVEAKDFFRYMNWEQGQHVACIAGTGRGKSVMCRFLAWQRSWVAWLSTKKKDDTYTDNISMGYERYKAWPIKKPPRDQRFQRAMVWPEYKSLLDVQRLGGPVFKKVLEDVYKDEGWCVVLDDLYFLSEKLKLREEITAINYQVRSLGVSMLAAMQRPKKIPLESWDQSSHLFVKRLNNYDDLLILRGAIGRDMKVVEHQMKQLGEWDWAYYPMAEPDKPPVIIRPTLGKDFN
jgi:hypothetical protein